MEIALSKTGAQRSQLQHVMDALMRIVDACRRGGNDLEVRSCHTVPRLCGGARSWRIDEMDRCLRMMNLIIDEFSSREGEEVPDTFVDTLMVWRCLALSTGSLLHRARKCMTPASCLQGNDKPEVVFWRLASIYASDVHEQFGKLPEVQFRQLVVRTADGVLSKRQCCSAQALAWRADTLAVDALSASKFPDTDVESLARRANEYLEFMGACVDETSELRGALVSVVHSAYLAHLAVRSLDGGVTEHLVRCMREAVSDGHVAVMRENLSIACESPGPALLLCAVVRALRDVHRALAQHTASVLSAPLCTDMLAWTALMTKVLSLTSHAATSAGIARLPHDRGRIARRRLLACLQAAVQWEGHLEDAGRWSRVALLLQSAVSLVKGCLPASLPAVTFMSTGYNAAVNAYNDRRFVVAAHLSSLVQLLPVKGYGALNLKVDSLIVWGFFKAGRVRDAFEVLVRVLTRQLQVGHIVTALVELLVKLQQKDHSGTVHGDSILANAPLLTMLQSFGYGLSAIGHRVATSLLVDQLKFAQVLGASPVLQEEIVTTLLDKVLEPDRPLQRGQLLVELAKLRRLGVGCPPMVGSSPSPADTGRSQHGVDVDKSSCLASTDAAVIAKKAIALVDSSKVNGVNVREHSLAPVVDDIYALAHLWMGICSAESLRAHEQGVACVIRAVTYWTTLIMESCPKQCSHESPAVGESLMCAVCHHRFVDVFATVQHLLLSADFLELHGELSHAGTALYSVVQLLGTVSSRVSWAHEMRLDALCRLAVVQGREGNTQKARRTLEEAKQSAAKGGAVSPRVQVSLRAWQAIFQASNDPQWSLTELFATVTPPDECRTWQDVFHVAKTLAQAAHIQHKWPRRAPAGHSCDPLLLARAAMFLLSGLLRRALDIHRLPGCRREVRSLPDRLRWFKQLPLHSGEQWFATSLPSEYEVMSVFFQSIRAMGAHCVLKNLPREARFFFKFGLTSAERLGVLAYVLDFSLHLAATAAKEFRWKDHGDWLSRASAAMMGLKKRPLRTVDAVREMIVADAARLQKDAASAHASYQCCLAMADSQVRRLGVGANLHLSLPWLRFSCRAKRKKAAMHLDQGDMCDAARLCREVLMWAQELDVVEVGKAHLILGQALLGNDHEQYAREARGHLQRALLLFLDTAVVKPALISSAAMGLFSVCGCHDMRLASFLVNLSQGVLTRQHIVFQLTRLRELVNLASTRPRGLPLEEEVAAVGFPGEDVSCRGCDDDYQEILRRMTGDFFDRTVSQLAPGTTFVCIRVDRVLKSLALCRFGSDTSNPLLLRVPLAERVGSRSFFELVTLFADLVKRCNTSAACGAKMHKSDWWQLRRGQDRELEALLCDLESWLGGLKCVFMPASLDGDLMLASCRASAAGLVSKLLASRRRELLPQAHELLNLFVDMAARSDGEHQVSQDEAEVVLQHVVALSCASESGLHIDVTQLAHDVLRAAVPKDSHPSEKRIRETGCHPLILALDDEVQALPWESLPLLRGINHSAPVYRVPCLEFYAVRVRAALEQIEPPVPTSVANISTKPLFYVVNPQQDLAATQARFAPIIAAHPRWKGVMGRAPTREEFRSGLHQYEVFLYVGHNGGQRFFETHELETVYASALVLLMGCSSGALSGRGVFAPTGVVNSYMVAGCPAVVANLWDVTDRDIDVFCEGVLRRCGLTGAPAGTRVDVGTSVNMSRNDCKLKYLNGAAPVCYGVPFTCRR